MHINKRGWAFLVNGWRHHYSGKSEIGFSEALVTVNSVRSLLKGLSEGYLFRRHKLDLGEYSRKFEKRQIVYLNVVG